MATLLTSTEHITRSKACRVTFSQFGKHHFGGMPSIHYSGIKPPFPIHHIFTLDSHDRHSPLLFDGIRYIPLLYPLAYSEGDGSISYQVLEDFKVKITHLSEFSPNDSPYFLLDSLPERRAALRVLSYAERRILGSDIRERSAMDRRRMNRLWNGECFRIAGILEYDAQMGWCPSGAATEKKPCNAWRFAYFPASKRPFGDIWHEYSSDVWLCFSLCTDCGTIHAFNECT